MADLILQWYHHIILRFSELKETHLPMISGNISFVCQLQYGLHIFKLPIAIPPCISSCTKYCLYLYYTIYHFTSILCKTQVDPSPSLLGQDPHDRGPLGGLRRSTASFRSFRSLQSLPSLPASMLLSPGMRWDELSAWHSLLPRIHLSHTSEP